MSLLSNVRIARRRVGLMFAVFVASALGACRTDIRGAGRPTAAVAATETMTTTTEPVALRAGQAA